MSTPKIDLGMACVLGFQGIMNESGIPTDMSAAMGFCGGEMQRFGTAVSREISYPAMVTGLCVPFVAAGLVLSITRLFRIVNPRAIFLLAGNVGSLLILSMIIYAYQIDGVNWFVSDSVGVAGFLLLLLTLPLAGIIRFTAVIVNRQRRQMVQYSVSGMLLIWTVVAGYVGGSEIHKSTESPVKFTPIFYGLCFVPLVTYASAGFIFFSYNLSRLKAQTGENVLHTLKVVNDGMMVAVLILTVIQMCVMLPLRTTYYSNSVACLNVSAAHLVENVFESITNLVRGRAFFTTGSSGGANRSGQNINMPIMAAERTPSRGTGATFSNQSSGSLRGGSANRSVESLGKSRLADDGHHRSAHGRAYGNHPNKQRSADRV
ncbi:hypothetical protein DFS34DRAFT_593945 [Phlyctochytrium arcticum]|nr:hypothetical protein DFS34DRAFT_593945 [Phlyctochytrium arcticum]